MRAAECLGWEDRLGKLQACKLADITLMKTNLLQDVRSLENANNIALMMKEDRVVKDICAKMN